MSLFSCLRSHADSPGAFGTTPLHGVLAFMPSVSSAGLAALLNGEHDDTVTHKAALPLQYDVLSYFALADEGLFAADERTELLDGIIVAMPPQSPLHAAAVCRVENALRAALGAAPGASTVVRVQMPLVAGTSSVPEPDIAVVAGSEADYIDRHPSTALLVVEVSVSTATQDRLTKAAIYAGAGVKNYWIVSPGEGVLHVYAQVRPELRTYERVSRVVGATLLELDGIAEVRVRSEDLFPRRAA